MDTAPTISEYLILKLIQIIETFLENNVTMFVRLLIFYIAFQSCWLSVDTGLIWAFIAPVIVVLVVNTAMFIQALVIAKKSLHKRSDSMKGDKGSTSSKLTLFKGNDIFQLKFVNS